MKSYDMEVNYHPCNANA